jgi:hypothetical protein
MSDPRKPIDNGRSWKAEFLPGSPGEKAIESLGLRPDHLRHDLVAFDEQIESLTAEITRLRLRLAAWKAEAEAWRLVDDRYPMTHSPVVREARERRAATDAIEKNAS